MYIYIYIHTPGEKDTVIPPYHGHAPSPAVDDMI